MIPYVANTFLDGLGNSKQPDVKKKINERQKLTEHFHLVRPSKVSSSKKSVVKARFELPLSRTTVFNVLLTRLYMRP